jgi:hypothetical protein
MQPLLAVLALTLHLWRVRACPFNFLFHAAGLPIF